MKEWPSAEITACPFPFYAALREQGVYKSPGREEYLVTRWEDVCLVARDTERFSNMNATADETIQRIRGSFVGGQGGTYTPFGMASSDPPEHKAKRALGQMMFTRERLRSYEPAIRRIADDLIDGWIDRGECEFRAEFSDVLPIHVVGDILGFPREDTPSFMRWGRIESQGVRYLSPERQAEETELVSSCAEYVRTALRERLERPRDDFLTELLQAQVARDGEPDIDYLTAEGVTYAIAGHMTTAHMLANALLLLLRHPEQMARVRADRSLIRGLCEEALRLESPVQWLTRVCTQDTELSGTPIPAGARVLVFWAAGNRDPERFDDPDAFDVDRPELAKRQLGFGFGPHLCIGAPLARLEGQIAFDALFDRLPEIRLDEARSDLENIESVVFRAPKSLWIAF